MQQLEVILAHELAHIRRYDPLMNALQILIETLLFYHPAVWWTSGRIRHERELCCDDVALSCCGDALCYARALTALEKLRGVPAILAVGSTGGSLLYRIRRIMGERAGDYSPSKVSGVLAVAFAIGCLAINVTTRIQAQDLPKSQSIYRSPGVEVDTAGAEIVEPVRYPREAAEKAIQGTVVVQADVDARGNVADARVLSGPPELRKAVLRPVLAMRFKSTGTASTRQITATFQVPPLQELEREDEVVWTVKRMSEQKLRAELDAAKRQAQDSTGEEERRRARLMLEQAQKKLAEQLAQIDSARAANSRAAELETQVNDSLANVARLSEMERSAVSMLDRARGSGMFDGRILAQIDAAGLSEEERVQLMKQLPMKIGDTLSQENVAGVRAAIRASGNPLRFELIILDNNQALLKIGRKEPALPGGTEELVRLNEEISSLEAQLEMLRKNYTNQHPDVRDFEAKLKAMRRLREEMARQRTIDGTGEVPAK
jgi:TonB family protein